jgi:hypothetical protein
MLKLVKRLRHEIFYSLIACTVFATLAWLFRLPGFLRFVVETIAVAIIAFGVSAIIRLWEIREHIEAISSYRASLAPSLRAPILPFIKLQFSAWLQGHSCLTDKTGLCVTREALNLLSGNLFSHCVGSYCGTDSNPPSAFLERYPTYIIHQAQREESRPSSDVRCLLVDISTLESDFDQNRKRFLSFLDAHIRNDIVLLQVDPGIATNCVKSLELPSSDLGVFGGRYAAYFTPCLVPSDERSAIVSVVECSKELREKLLSYFGELVNSARRIRIENTHLIIKPLDNESQSEYLRRIESAIKG